MSTVEAIAVEMRDDPDDHVCSDVGAERPRGFCVAHDDGGVGQVLDHDAAPQELLTAIEQLAVDEVVSVAAVLHAQGRWQ
jgi:hypothetical protein